MYFDRILFGAAFVTLIATAALALVPSLAPLPTPLAAVPAPAVAATAEPQALPSLERVVVIGKREDARI